VVDDSLVAFVLETLPPPPARVLEVGAGAGELAEDLRHRGHDVVAIDPAGDAPGVRAVPLHQLEASDGSFDAALAVVSLHHVEPLAESCERLGSVLRREGVLVIDEFDLARFDLVAARWWASRAPADDDHELDPEEIVAHMREHLHPLRRILDALAPWFEFGEPARGPYLYRWNLGPHVRPAEERDIERGRLPATGARVVGRRR
jgi:SAM-dependent methyltransferase